MVFYIFIFTNCQRIKLTVLWVCVSEVDRLPGPESEQVLRHPAQHLHRHAAQRLPGAARQHQGNSRRLCSRLSQFHVNNRKTVTTNVSGGSATLC